ncbi:MAG: hypothetical protein M3Y28_08300 [Armatimonadota bacterium]|nr:hypothetical protein [Armatimonadota bacterium]
MTRKPDSPARRDQRSQIMSMLMVLVLVILLIQLWLLTIALEEYLAAHLSLALPTFLASCFCFALNLWLLKYVYDVDKKED